MFLTWKKVENNWTIFDSQVFLWKQQNGWPKTNSSCIQNARSCCNGQQKNSSCIQNTMQCWKSTIENLEKVQLNQSFLQIRQLLLCTYIFKHLFKISFTWKQQHCCLQIANLFENHSPIRLFDIMHQCIIQVLQCNSMEVLN